MNQLCKEFGKEHELSKNIGKLHGYLGITIDYSIKGKVVFTMFDYLKDIIVECPDDFKKATPIFPANDNLFKLDEDSPRLHNKKSDLHRITARLGNGNFFLKLGIFVKFYLGGAKIVENAQFL